MKIILLPGMDGTGKLFEPFSSFLPASTIAVSLPQSGSQAYEFLAAHIAAQLPYEEFIIVPMKNLLLWLNLFQAQLQRYLLKNL